MGADWSFYEDNAFTTVINVNGTMTGLGASMAISPVAKAMSEILPRFVNIHELQSQASSVISDLTGAQAGVISASASAGISMAIAGSMTGAELGAIERLPDTRGLKNEVVIQAGHLCNYGAPIDQAIRITGAKVVSIGQSTQTQDHQLASAINESTCAALYVVSHHVVEYGQMPLERFVEICHAKNVPVIVDAASEYDLRGFLATGADIVIYSGHKFLSGPTSGIIAGKQELVHASYMQNLGIARGMKVGKESIFGVMAALNAWKTRDHDGFRAREKAALKLWQEAFMGFEGITATPMPDPTHNPLDRLRVNVNSAQAGFSALDLAGAFASLTPPIIVRSHEAELGYIALDPCNLAEGHAELVAKGIEVVLNTAKTTGLSKTDPDAARNGGITDYQNWGQK